MCVCVCVCVSQLCPETPEFGFVKFCYGKFLSLSLEYKFLLGTGTRGHYEMGLSVEESLKSLRPLNSLVFGTCSGSFFTQFEASLELESPGDGLFWEDPCTRVKMELFALLAFLPQFAGEKRVYTTTVAPLLFRSVARPRGHRAKKGYGVYHFPGKIREKGIHHRSGKKGIHHRASDPEKEKRGVSTVVVYTFFFPEFGDTFPFKRSVLGV